MNDLLKKIFFSRKGFISEKSHADFLLENGFDFSSLFLYYNMTNAVLQYVLAKSAAENKN